MFYKVVFHRVGLPSLKIRPSPWSIQARLPKIYTDFRKELEKEPSAVHFIPEEGKWKLSPYNYKVRVENVPIPLIFPKQADEGIWGGEGVIQGFIVRSSRRHSFTYPNFWFPKLKRTVVYSEILNKYMTVTVTERALQLFDKHYGFDNYILETPVQDLKSQLALDLRRKMLLALVNKEVCYDDSSQQKKIWEKYKKFELPKEEAEWFGLSLKEAIKKQRLLEEENKNPPLKHYYREVFFEKLKTNKIEAKEEAEKPWLSKIPLKTLLGRESKKEKS